MDEAHVREIFDRELVRIAGRPGGCPAIRKYEAEAAVEEREHWLRITQKAEEEK